MMHLAGLSILMTADTVGGVWTFATALSGALAASGVNVHLVTQGPVAGPEQRSMLAPSVHLIESPLALEWQDPDGSDVAAARRFFAELQARLAPDIVHLNGFREAAFAWGCPVVVSAHSCVNSWAIACNDGAWLSEPRWRRYTESVSLGLDRAHAWVRPTRTFYNSVRDLYRPCSPGHVVWNGIASKVGTAIQKENFVLAAGRMWDAAKNLSALAQVSDEIAWRIRVAGPAADAAACCEGIELLGPVSHVELDCLMQRAAVYVSPARYEPFGLAVLEAASRGCALVLSDIPTFRELWDGAALFVEANDVAALRACLTRLAADAAMRAFLQQAALLRSRRYTLRKMADRYAALYHNLLGADTKADLTLAAEVMA